MMYLLLIGAATLVAILILSLVEREPIAKEMTLAYRQYVIERLSANTSLSAELSLRRDLDHLSLSKEGCTKMAEHRYRCLASVDKTTQRFSDASEGVYSKTNMGWRYMPVPQPVAAGM